MTTAPSVSKKKIVKEPTPKPKKGKAPTRKRGRLDSGFSLSAMICVGRECKGWSQRRLARASRVSNSVLSRIEAGHIKDPGFSTVVKVCDALGIPLDFAVKNVRKKR